MSCANSPRRIKLSDHTPHTCRYLFLLHYKIILRHAANELILCTISSTLQCRLTWKGLMNMSLTNKCAKCLSHWLDRQQVGLLNLLSLQYELANQIFKLNQIKIIRNAPRLRAFPKGSSSEACWSEQINFGAYAFLATSRKCSPPPPLRKVARLMN